MATSTQKQRIIALQKALRLAKGALQRYQHNGRIPDVSDVLYEIEKLDWNSKPDLTLGAHR